MAPQTETQSRRAAIYLRISKDAEHDGLAVERQLADCQREAKRKGWGHVPEALIYAEDPASASNTRAKRPVYNRLVADYSAGAFDALICYDLDRLTRQPRQLEDWIDAAEGQGLALVTANGEADLTTDGGRMYARIKVAVAKGEVERKGARQRRANLQRVEAGGHYARNTPFGYRGLNKMTVAEKEEAKRSGRKMVHDPETAHHVKRCFKMVLEEQRSLNDVATYLREQGVSTKRGHVWGNSSVHKFLTNPVYAGVLVFKGEHRGVGAWEPYITPEQHARIKASFETNNRAVGIARAPKAEFPLSGLLTCTCGAPMTGRTRVGGRRAYACSTRSSGACMRETRAVQAEERVTRFVLAALLGFSPDSLLSPEIQQRQEELGEQLVALDREAEGYRTDLTLSRADRATFLREITTERDVVLAELEGMTRDNLLAGLVAHVLDWRSGYDPELVIRSHDLLEERWESLSMHQQREIIEALGEYRVKAPGSTRATYVEIYPKNLNTGEVLSTPIST